MALGELIGIASDVSTEKFFLVTTPKITGLTKAVSQNLLVYLTPAFTIASIYEFVREGRFFDLLLKLALAISIITSGQSIIEYGCKEGFRLSDQIASFASGNSAEGNWLPRFILNSKASHDLSKLKDAEYKKLKTFSKKAKVPSVNYMLSKSMSSGEVAYTPNEMDVENTDSEKLKEISSLERNGIPDFGITDTLMIGVLLGACLIVKLVFTAGYYLTITLLVVPCILLFIPTLNASFSGLLKTMVFCFLLPVVFTILLFLLGEMIQDSFFDPRFVSLEKTVMLIVMSIIVVMSIFITGAIISVSGISSALGAAGAMMGSQLIRQTVGNATSAGTNLLKSSLGSVAGNLIKNPYLLKSLSNGLTSFAKSRPDSLLSPYAQKLANNAKTNLKAFSSFESPKAKDQSLGISKTLSSKSEHPIAIPSKTSLNEPFSNTQTKKDSSLSSIREKFPLHTQPQDNAKVFENPNPQTNEIANSKLTPNTKTQDQFKYALNKKSVLPPNKIKSQNEKITKRKFRSKK